MGKESFLIYKSFYKPISRLSDKQLGRLFRAIFQYQLGEVVTIEGDIEMAFEFFKSQFELDENKYQSIVERNRENGRKAAIKKEQNEEPKQPNGGEWVRNNPVAADNDNDKDNDIIEKESKKKNVRFSPPTIEEVRAYIQEKGLSVNADAFYNYYEANGWMVGRNKMKKWQAAVTKWHNTNYGEQKADIGVVLRAEPNKYDNDEELWGSSI